MNDETFNERMKNALKAKAEGRPQEAAAELEKLLQNLIPAVKAGVNDWHHQQALELLVDALEAAGSDEQCRAAWEELIDLTRQNAIYWDKALSSARADFTRWGSEHPR